MKQILFFIIFNFINLYGQNTGIVKGKIEIVQSPEIKSLMDKHIEINEANETIDGFRIQIHFGGEREKAKSITGLFRV